MPPNMATAMGMDQPMKAGKKRTEIERGERDKASENKVSYRMRHVGYARHFAQPGHSAVQRQQQQLQSVSYYEPDKPPIELLD
jgi:hypothetical protein